MTAAGVAPVMERIRAEGVIAILRTETADDARRAAAAAAAGGIRLIEVTFTVPDAAAVIAGIIAEHGEELCVGAGTVVDAEQLAVAAEAGAEFIVSPGIIEEVVTGAVARGLAVLPGVFSATEALRAVALGAPAVKLFPAGALSPGYVSALRSPLPGIEVIPSGGIGVEDIGAWIRAGSAAVGIGGRLSPSRVDTAAAESITSTAQAAVAALREAREN